MNHFYRSHVCYNGAFNYSCNINLKYLHKVLCFYIVYIYLLFHDLRVCYLSLCYFFSCFQVVIFIYCFRLIAASVHTLKSILRHLHSSIAVLYIPPIIPPHFLSQCKENYTLALQNTISKSQSLCSELSSSKWIIVFRHYMNRKMNFVPTSMCRVALSVSPYFTGIFI